MDFESDGQQLSVYVWVREIESGTQCESLFEMFGIFDIEWTFSPNIINRNDFPLGMRHVFIQQMMELLRWRKNISY